MFKILITGGAGFIGSNIVEELVRRGEEVKVLDNFVTGRRENLKEVFDQIELIEGDIRDKKILRKALQNIDYVIHEAALRSVPRSVEDPLSTNEVNITGTLNLLWEAKNARVKRVVFASSSSVYGDLERFPQIEDQPPSPISPYALSKLAGEHYGKIFSKIYGQEVVSLRYFNVFGPKQDPLSEYAAVIPKFILSALSDEPLEIHGDGLQSRDFTYVKNVVEATILATTVPNISGEVFNIACGKTHSILDIKDTITKILGKELKFFHTESRKGDVRKTWGDISKMEKLLGHKPKINFEEGIRRTVEWFKNFENR